MALDAWNYGRFLAMGGDRENDWIIPLRDHRERMDLVLKYFVEGMSVPTIVQQLKSKHGLTVGRDVPYQDISRATARRWLKYEPPPERELSDRLHNQYEALLDAYVPSYGERMTVMQAGARLCTNAIHSIAEAKAKGLALQKDERDPEGPPGWRFPVRYPDQNGMEVVKNLDALEMDPEELDDVHPDPMVVEIRIGFSGGHTMSWTAHDLGQGLAAHVEEWEKGLKKLVFDTMKRKGLGDRLPDGITKRRFKVKLKFVFVNLVSGFVPDPKTNPIAFLTALLDDPELASRAKVDVFNAMPFVEIGKGRDIINEIPPLREIRKDYEKKGFDIILTSASSINDPHSTVRHYYRDKELTNLLMKEGVQGDYFWLPITKTKPYSLRALRKRLEDSKDKRAEHLKYRPMTLLTLEDLAAHVKRKRDVFFIVAPCALCSREKSQIAKAVLDQTDALATHLIADRETAAGILGESKKK